MIPCARQRYTYSAQVFDGSIVSGFLLLTTPPAGFGEPVGHPNVSAMTPFGGVQVHRTDHGVVRPRVCVSSARHDPGCTKPRKRFIGPVR